MDDHTVNADKKVAVATNVFWKPIDEHTPQGVKLQVIHKPSNSAKHGIVTPGENFWTHWAPLPDWPDDV